MKTNPIVFHQIRFDLFFFYKLKTNLKTQKHNSQHVPTTQILSLKDASSQTTPSDCENMLKSADRDENDKKRKMYDRRRLTESMLSAISPTFTKGKTLSVINQIK